MTRSPLQDAEFLPFQLDVAQRRVLLLRLTARQRAEAAFLDQRAMPQPPQGAWAPLRAVVDEGLRLPSPAMGWIFHIGHCGSTLLSRLLQAWPGQQVLREPLPLRTLAAESFQNTLPPADVRVLLEALPRLWARPLDGVQSTSIKATSSCNGLIGGLLETRTGDRAILLSMPLRGYLATLLKSAGAIEDVAASGGERMALLQRALPDAVLPPPRSAGEACAMAWLAERLRFDALADASERLLRVDFEDLLAAPRAILSSVAAHLRLDPAHLDDAVASPWWNRYAKAGEHAYGAADRAHDQRLAQTRFAGEIARGVAWVRGVSPRHAD
ncbi:MAG: hypothetical protein KIS72_00180 [Luteimonas sp.]|nr:hypothetical protein [Luteimonas sp.]